MKNYVKLTAAIFEQSLTKGKYDTATGARRAIGKSQMTDKDKAKAHKAVNVHFEEGEAPAQAAPKVAKKTTPAVPPATTKAAPKSPSAPAASSPDQELQRTNTVVRTTAAAMAGLASARQADATVDTTEAVRVGTNILEKSLVGLNAFLTKVTGTTTPPYPSHMNGVGSTGTQTRSVSPEAERP